MSIGTVLDQLRDEFPEVTISKLRFLEEQGLVTPNRAPSGYRKYSQADVERVRYVLGAQRDSYLPLKVIKERLEALDSGAAEATPTSRIVGEDSATVRRLERLTMDELVLLADVDESLVMAFADAGLIEPIAAGRFGPDAVTIVKAAAALVDKGIDVRNLRTFLSTAQRQVELIDQVTAPLRSRGRSDAKASADTSAREMGELASELHRSLVRAAIARL